MSMLTGLLLMLSLNIKTRANKSYFYLLTVLVVVFLAPFLILFESNFGWLDTYRYLFSSRETKLVHIKAQAGFFEAINFLNHSYPDKRTFLVSQNYFPVSYYFQGKPENLLVDSPEDKLKPAKGDIIFSLGELDPKKKSYKFKLVKSFDGNNIYQVL